MKSYTEIFQDFFNTTRLKFRSFISLIEERKNQEQEQLSLFFKGVLDRLQK